MWQLIGSAVAGLMIILAMPVYNDIQANNLNATVDADAASQFQTILAGAQKYVAAQKDTLTDTLSIGGAYQEIPFMDLLNTDSLPGGFSQTNVLGATWHVYVQQPASGAIRTMVAATGGLTLKQSDLINIAGLTGDQGGYVPYDGMLGLNSSEAHGTTWNLSLTGLPSPGAGHLFGTVTVGDAASPTIDTNDFLYRVGVPGHDELNTMGVALNMGSNDINNAGTVHAVKGAFTGHIGTDGLDPDEAPTGFGGGIHTADIWAEGSVAIGHNQSLSLWATNGGMFTSPDNSMTNGPGTGLEGKLSTQTWATGQMHGTMLTAGPYTLFKDGYPIGGKQVRNAGIVGVNQQGFGVASQFMQGQIFRPSYTASAGAACGQIPSHDITELGTDAYSDADAFYAQDGDVAKDGNGNTLSCVNGVWTQQGVTITEQLYVTTGPVVFDGTRVTKADVTKQPHQYCALTETENDGSDSNCYINTLSGSYWQLTASSFPTNGQGQTNCTMLCIN